MEPGGVDILFLAAVPVKASGGYGAIGITPDGSVRNSRPATASGRGEIESTPQPIGIYFAESDTRDPEPLVRDSNSQDYPARVVLLYTQLPRLDPRIPQLAKQITAGNSSHYTTPTAIAS